MQGTLFVFEIDYVWRLKMQAKTEDYGGKYLCSHHWNAVSGIYEIWMDFADLKKLVWFFLFNINKLGDFQRQTYICFYLFNLVFTET